jgi:protein gp37
MVNGLVNLTLPVVIQEIEHVLEEYPKHPYQTAFAIPELHQKLVAHVLSNVSNAYVVEGVQELSRRPNVRHSPPIQERLRMEMVVRGGILHILRENANWLIG